MIALVTETLSCMSPADCSLYGVILQPLHCTVDGLTEIDRVMEGERMLSGGDACSIPPSEEAYCARFGSLLENHDGIICITASGKFSLSHRNALRAAAGFDGRVMVMDSGTVAGGLFLLVLRARHMVTLGYPMSRIKGELEAYRNTLRVSFTTKDVRMIEKAKRLRGRLPEAADGSSKHPIFRIENGEIRVNSFAEGSRPIADNLLSVFADPRTPNRRPPSRIVMHYANRSETVECLLRLIGELYPSATVYERPITLSIQVNLGYDILGVVGD